MCQVGKWGFRDSEYDGMVLKTRVQACMHQHPTQDYVGSRAWAACPARVREDSFHVAVCSAVLPPATPLPLSAI